MYIKVVLRFLCIIVVSILHFRYEQLEVKDSIFFTIVSLTPHAVTNKEEVLNIYF